jgi:hypothetical protein
MFVCSTRAMILSLSEIIIVQAGTKIRIRIPAVLPWLISLRLRPRCGVCSRPNGASYPWDGRESLVVETLAYLQQGSGIRREMPSQVLLRNVTALLVRPASAANQIDSKAEAGAVIVVPFCSVLTSPSSPRIGKVATTSQSHSP